MAEDPVGSQFRLAQPDLAFRLSQNDRARIAPTFSSDSLEQLLQWVHPDYRQEVLQEFLIREPLVIPLDGKLARLGGFTTSFGDDVIDSHLAQVWAPYWRALPTGELEVAAESPIPGLKEAKHAQHPKRPGGL